LGGSLDTIRRYLSTENGDLAVVIVNLLHQLRIPEERVIYALTTSGGLLHGSRESLGQKSVWKAMSAGLVQ
jgi:hypothetical protein